VTIVLIVCTLFYTADRNASCGLGFLTMLSFLIVLLRSPVSFSVMQSHVFLPNYSHRILTTKVNARLFHSDGIPPISVDIILLCHCVFVYSNVH